MISKEAQYYPNGHWLSEKQLHKLRDLLGNFSFEGSEADSDDVALLKQQYLSFYNIDFPGEFPELELRHDMGKIHSAEFEILCQAWRPWDFKAWVVLVHGYYDHMGIYQHIIRHLLKEGYAVLGFDLPGHGLSTGERASIASFDQYSKALQNVRALLNEEQCPIHVLGQSTGCAAIMNALLAQQTDDFDKVLLLAPLVKPFGWNSGQWLFKLLNNRINSMPRRFAINSHNIPFMKFLAEQDVLQPKQLSVTWVAAMKEWLEKVEAVSEPCDKAIVIIQGTDDKTVDWEFNLPQIEKAFSQVKVELIEEGRHQLVNEALRYREQVFRQVSQHLA
ncbi:alpha/beta hydrolase [Pseudoteredinibacter isoporae]|uniref:Lysophospholipase n=1 Tax=Pseudoteredinibacter isoporae TaxID=570281 RepID=A0A7X0JQJ8_9GAMM|nr:alpha/beta hydrolase [Pseudoteredinibacter isoporae]MBB6519959.1 lysophospholipase [Pseudoteredinibacter isoporae]NHO85532.1 alpha/beta hydrolase [Pseudoteredinibacter isoporae]NIB26016.1 alpha/beta hydrolase [Pseudoteredinibacter isoporae]